MAIKDNLLNPMQIEAAKAQTKEYTLRDGDGLYLRVRQSGSKQWIFNYRHPDTKKKNNLSYGSYPDVSLKLARERAEADRKILKDGLDPKQEKDKEALTRKQNAVTTFKAVADDWLALEKTKLASATYKKNSRYFEKDIFPLIGSYPIKDITAPLGISVIKKIGGRGSQEIARKTARAMNSVMTFAVNTGLIQHNPLLGIKAVIPKTKQENRPTLKPHELPELMNALAYSNAKVTTRCLIEFQLATMVRPREAAEAKWSEIDLDNGLWIIPAERMKMKVEHQVPLTNHVINILDTMKPFSGHREYIFPSHIHPNKPANAETANKALRTMGFTGRLVAHGMRALASTTLNEFSFDDDVIETALAHKDSNKIRQAYNRAKYLERRKVMMQWWSDRIVQAKTGKMSDTNATKTLRLVNE